MDMTTNEVEAVLAEAKQRQEEVSLEVMRRHIVGEGRWDTCNKKLRGVIERDVRPWLMGLSNEAFLAVVEDRRAAYLEAEKKMPPAEEEEN